MFRTQSKSRPATQWLGVLLQTTLLAAPAVWAAPSTSPQNVNVVNTPLVTVTSGSVSVSGNVNASVSGDVGITNTASNPVPVQVLIPSRPFSSGEVPFDASKSANAGPGGPDHFAVTAITLTNLYASATAYVEIRNVSTSGDSCSGAINSLDTRHFLVLVQPLHTLHLEYPTPVIYSKGCVDFSETSGIPAEMVRATVHGFSVAPQ